MQTPKIFASIMFVSADKSSGVYNEELPFDPALSVNEYCDFFLEQIKLKSDVQKVTLFSLEISKHDKNGDYLLDENNQIERIPIDCDISALDLLLKRFG